MRRRRNRNQDCLEKGKHFDSIVLHEHVKTFGCTPPYLQSVENYSKNENKFDPCKSQEKIKESKYEFYKVTTNYYPKACQRISRLNYDLGTYNPQQQWKVKIFYPEEVKIITQSQEVDVHSLIGNIGGYIGLFLGKLKLLRKQI